MRIALAGSGKLALSLMQALFESDHTIVALIQNGRVYRGWRRSLALGFSRLFPSPNSVMGLAARHRIPVVFINTMNDSELAPLRALEPDLLLVGGFGIIIKKPLLELPRFGCVNVHSSLLPRHRGPNPFSAVILADEKETGVTFHVIDEGIDTGDIIEQYAFSLDKDDNTMSAHLKSAALAKQQVVEVMDRIAREGIKGTPQDPARATYDKKLTSADCRIDWRQSAHAIQRLVRASRPLVLPWFDWRRGRVFVTVTAIEDKPAENDAAPGTVVQARPCVRVATQDGVLTIVSAYTLSPFPWIWPSPWNRPRPGEKLE